VRSAADLFVVRERKTLREAGPAVHDDRVKWTFTATTANTLWFGDITEHGTDGTLSLSAIEDFWPNRMVGYSIDSDMGATLAVRTLHSAIGARPHRGFVLHSIAGANFAPSGTSRSASTSNNWNGRCQPPHRDRNRGPDPGAGPTVRSLQTRRPIAVTMVGTWPGRGSSRAR
jgi:transposase InsO family protein